MNIATGTFGSGIPEKCPDCKYQPTGIFYQFIADGWHANEKTK
jgi:hypothetical protein